MNEKYIQKISNELSFKTKQIQNTISLLNEGATIPFISRYRKEATDSLDEVQITDIRDRFEQLVALDKRKEAIINSLTERNLLTDELKIQIDETETMSVLEDIYLPYKPKKRTRATIAKEKGLEPLAQRIYIQENFDINSEAEKLLDQEKELSSVEEVLSGARDIIAEWVNEDQDVRSKIRDLFFNSGFFRSKVMAGKEVEGIKYKDYFNWEEPVSTAPSHRVLAMRRGENENILSLRISPPELDAIFMIENILVKKDNTASEQVKFAIKDSYKRLLSLSMETEVRIETKLKADLEAIHVFSDNLRQLLLSPPLGQKAILAIDPGFRTGCKVVCLDKQGKLLHNDTIHPFKSDGEAKRAADLIYEFCMIYKIDIIAIGNGTAGRETEEFLRKSNLPNTIPIVMVNESGASIYSASEVAREEFSDYDITVRGSVSIGRRLQDPLAELVKIEPKSIGVGQYQHDVDQSLLKKSLDETVISCVNAVGVELNTASKQLLTYVSGLGEKLAQNIINYRNQNGPFKSRDEILNVPRLGPKAYEQAAGFLRIRDAKNPLDQSAVHPESYYIVYKIAEDIKCTLDELMKKENIRKQIDLKKYCDDKIGLPTLNDILNELSKPGRDPREEFEIFKFSEGINKIEDLTIGMKLPGIVTNVTNFGAFVDLGVHQDGLVHISQISNKFIKNPADILKVQQKVIATVIEIDIDRKRIALSLKNNI